MTNNQNQPVNRINDLNIFEDLKKKKKTLLQQLVRSKLSFLKKS